MTPTEPPLPGIVVAATELAATSALSFDRALAHVQAAGGWVTKEEADARATHAAQQERARVVAWLERARDFFARGEGILEEDEIARRVNVAALDNVIAAITRGDHEVTPDA
jgi:hypothetical protein